MQIISPSPPDHLKQLLTEISARYSALSNRLQRIARYAVEHPNDMAMDTIAVIADRAQVQPSALIRFAKAFGYSGFSEMQQVFRQTLKEQSPSYSERVRLFWEQRDNSSQFRSATVLKEFADASCLALEHLQQSISDEQLDQTTAVLAAARIIHIIGQRRSFPVAAYLAYALNHSERPARLMDGIGGMLAEQLNLLTDRDALIAISFHPYASETVEVAAQAAANGISVIAITDSPFSPIAEKADQLFAVEDAEVRGFRSLSASLCLAQTLAVSLVGLKTAVKKRVKSSNRAQIKRSG